jgi:citrate lyase subunit beta/citryl-CoA lyase
MHVVRSLLSVPGHLEDYIAKAAQSGADCIALDLQDGVPPDKKAEARATIRKALGSGRLAHQQVMVRVNHADTGLTQSDLVGVACAALGGFIYPMANTAQEVLELDAMLARREQTLGLKQGRFSILVLIETPLGVLNAYDLATASNRTVGLLFGAEDFLAEVQGRYDDTSSALHTPRALIAMAARAAGIEPLDTPYVRVHDVAGLEVHARRGRALGMSGMMVLSPRQIPIAHAVYTPSELEVQEAEAIMRAVTKVQGGGRSYSLKDGALVSPSRKKMAQRVLARHAAIKTLEETASNSSNG